jgi:hypothetical protein
VGGLWGSIAQEEGAGESATAAFDVHDLWGETENFALLPVRNYAVLFD